MNLLRITIMVFIVLIGRSKGLENETRHNDNDTEKRNEERNRVTVETSEEETNEDSNERRSEESNGGKHKECIKSTEGMNEEDSETKEHMNQEVNGDRNGGEEAKSDDVCDTKKDGSSDKEAATNLFYETADAYWIYRLKEDPEMATEDGFHDYDDTLQNFTTTDEKKEQCEGFLQQLRQINSAVLSKEDHVEFEVLEAILKTYVDGYQWKEFGYLNPINGFWNKIIPLWLKQMNFRTEGDFQTYNLRLQSYALQLDDMIEIMRRAVQLNRTNNIVSMKGVANFTSYQMFAQNFKLSQFNWPIKNYLRGSNIADSVRDELKSTFSDTYNLYLFPAIKRMRNFTVEEYLPATRPGEGVGSYDGGDEYYQACLQFHITKNYTTEEVRNVALLEVEKIQSKIQEVMTNQDFKGTLREFLLHLSTERFQEFYYHDRYELLSAYQDVIYNRITPKLSNIFHHEHLPKFPTSVVYGKDLGLGFEFTHYYEYALYINRLNALKCPRFMILAYALNKAVPGCDLQAQFEKKTSRVPYRRAEYHKRYYAVPFTTPDFLGYYEGWSLYAESLGEDLHLYNDPALEMFGHYLSDMQYAALCVVDTAIHKHGMNFAEARSYLSEHIPLNTIRQIDGEITRIITWPGRACAAKMGAIVIQQLRQTAMEQLGKDFNVRDFHRVVLDLGRVPLYMLEDHVEEWIRTSSAPPLMTSLWPHVAPIWITYVLVTGRI